MASKIKVDQIEGSTGSTVTIPTGQTLTITDGLAASTIGSGTLADARLPTITVAKGGTNLTSFTAGDVLYATGATTLAKLAKGTAAQVLSMNSGATAPEWAAASGGKIGAVAHTLIKTPHTMSGSSATWYAISGFNATITPTAAGSSIIVMGHLSTGCNNGGPAGTGFKLYRSVNSASDAAIDSITGDTAGSRFRVMVPAGSESGANWVQETGAFNVIDSSGTSLSYSLGNTVKYSMYWYANSANTVHLNKSDRDGDNSDDVRSTSSMTIMEVLA